MNSDWNYKDIIDLEYFFEQDDERNTAHLHKRDRDIYLSSFSESERETASGATLLASWLESRRKEQIDEPLPGDIAAETYNILRLILLTAGLLSGASAGMLFFSYSGDTPVNVLHFLAVFVISQICMAIILWMRAGLTALGIGSLARSGSISLLKMLFGRLASTLQREGKRKTSADVRLRLMAALGKVRIVKSHYGNLFYWPLFLLLQLFGICFNIGLLAATFFKVSVSDLAFGWQSTLQISSENLHNFCRLLALPWSWLFGEGSGYPNLDQIEGTKIILKEGISNLSTPDLISWWPFLLLAIVFYGLLLRCLQYGLGRYRLHRVANALQFDSPVARQVVRRMRTPLVLTQATPEAVTSNTENEKTTCETEQEQAHAPAVNLIQLLIPDEIHDACDMKALSAYLLRDGFTIQSVHRFLTDYDSDQQLLEEAEQDSWKESSGIVILMEAWMPPLVSFQSYLKSLREKVGTSLPILLRLVGKPSQQSALTPVRDETAYRIWQQKMQAIGDPHLDIDVLIHEDNT